MLPARIILLAAVFSLAMLALCVWLAAGIDTLGLRLAGHEQGLVVAKVLRDDADSLSAGDVLVALGHSRGRMGLEAADLAGEPDMVVNEIGAYQAFLRRQGDLHDMLADGPVWLEFADRRQITVLARPHRPLRELPWMFWLHLAVGGLAVLIGFGVLAHRQGDPASRWFAVMSLALMAAALAAGVYSTRELALPEALFNRLRGLNQTGTLLYTAAFASVLWYYPRRLGDFPLAAVLLALYLILAVAAWNYWLPSIDMAMRLPVLSGFALAIVLAVRQWRASRGQPVERASLRWFLFSWFAGSTLFLAIVFVPPLFGVSSAEVQGPAFLLLLTIHLGLALAVCPVGSDHPRFRPVAEPGAEGAGRSGAGRLRGADGLAVLSATPMVLAGAGRACIDARAAGYDAWHRRVPGRGAQRSGARLGSLAGPDLSPGRSAAAGRIAGGG